MHLTLQYRRLQYRQKKTNFTMSEKINSFNRKIAFLKISVFLASSIIESLVSDQKSKNFISSVTSYDPYLLQIYILRSLKIALNQKTAVFQRFRQHFLVYEKTFSSEVLLYFYLKQVSCERGYLNTRKKII